MTLNVDKSIWKRVAFGDVIGNVTDRVDDPSSAGVDRYVGLEHLDPGVLTVERWDSPDKVEAQKLRFQPGDVIFGRRRAYQKKVAKAEFDGICSAHALVLRAKPDVMDPDFLPVFIASDYFLDRAIAISVGSLSPTVNWRDLRVEQFDLPPLDQQKRIADLLWTLEGHRTSVVTLMRGLSSCLQLDMAERLSEFASTRRIGELADTRSGPSFAASDVYEEPVAGSVPVLGITNTKSDGSIDLSKVDYVVGLPDSTRKVDEASLVLIRTNGNRNRIGNVYLPPPGAYGYAVSAFQFLMNLGDPAHRDYVYWVLRTDEMQARMSEAASGTTGLGNLAVRWLNEQGIPWSESESERGDFVTAVTRFVTAERHAIGELAALDALRSTLLNAIFGNRP